MKNLKKASDETPFFEDDHGKWNKDYDLRAYTWNVRTLNWDITVIKEMQWTGHDVTIGPCDVYYSCHVMGRKFDVGFVVGEKFHRRALSFTPVNERLATIRIKAINISLICAHAPTDEKDDVTKDHFYERHDRY